MYPIAQRKINPGYQNLTLGWSAHMFSRFRKATHTLSFSPSSLYWIVDKALSWTTKEGIEVENIQEFCWDKRWYILHLSAIALAFSVSVLDSRKAINLIHRKLEFGLASKSFSNSSSDWGALCPRSLASSAACVAASLMKALRGGKLFCIKIQVFMQNWHHFMPTEHLSPSFLFSSSFACFALLPFPLPRPS